MGAVCRNVSLNSFEMMIEIQSEKKFKQGKCFGVVLYFPFLLTWNPNSFTVFLINSLNNLYYTYVWCLFICSANIFSLLDLFNWTIFNSLVATIFSWVQMEQQSCRNSDPCPSSSYKNIIIALCIMHGVNIQEVICNVSLWGLHRVSPVQSQMCVQSSCRGSVVALGALRVWGGITCSLCLCGHPQNCLKVLPSN